jgi:hypothetical protein
MSSPPVATDFDPSRRKIVTSRTLRGATSRGYSALPAEPLPDAHPTTFQARDPHLTTRRDARVGTWAAANNVEIAYTPTSSSWLNRIEAQFTALRYFTLDGTDHPSHKETGQHDPPVHHLA